MNKNLSYQNWVLQSTVDNYPYCSLPSILTAVETRTRLSSYNPIYSRLYMAKSTNFTISIYMDVYYNLHQFEFYGIQGQIQGELEGRFTTQANARDITVQGRNNNNEWVPIHSFTLPIDASWDTSQRYTLNTPGSYNAIKFNILNNHGATTETGISSISLFKRN